LKDHKHDHRRNVSEGNENAYEMQPATRQRSASGSNAMNSGSGSPVGNVMKYSGFESDMRRSNTTGRRVGEGLKKRFGSLRRSKKNDEV
jgi:hypothetical protein